MIETVHRDPAAAAIYALAASPAYSSDGVLFAAGGAGLLRSADRGATWASAYAALAPAAPLSTVAVALAPDFRATGAVFAGMHGAVLRSTDGGAAWHVATLPAPPPLVSALAVSPAYVENGVLCAASMQDGVFRSGDRGRSWTAWNFGLLDLNILCLAVAPAAGRDDTLFAGAESGIYRSANGGRAWRELPFPVEWAPVLALAVSPAYGVDGTLFAGSEEAGLCVSRDRGATWAQLAEDELAGPINALLLGPEFGALPHLLAVDGGGLSLSRDGGVTWRALPIPDDAEISALAAPEGLAPGAVVFAGCADGRILRLTLD